MALAAFILAGTTGLAVGAVLWYFAGRWLGVERLGGWSRRYGRWLFLSPAQLRRAHAWVDRWNVLAVFLGRTLPGLRGVICIPAGLTAMPFPPFFAASTLGSLLWATLLTLAGRQLAAKLPFRPRSALAGRSRLPSGSGWRGRSSCFRHRLFREGPSWPQRRLTRAPIRISSFASRTYPELMKDTCAAMHHRSHASGEGEQARRARP